MSTLQELLVALEAVNQDAERLSAQLAQQAQRLGQAAAQAAAATLQTSKPDGVRAAASLQNAQRATTQAAQNLHQAALVGRRFVSYHAGAGATGDQAASTRGTGASNGNSVPALDATDVAALGDYTGSGFRAINDSLRGVVPMSNDNDERATAVSKALSKLPDQKGPVFRGTTLTPAQISSYIPGTVHLERGFTSTSSDPASAFPGNALFLVISKHGKDVASYSTYPESEVLFDKGTEFYVTSNSYSPHQRKQVIVMMEL